MRIFLFTKDKKNGASEGAVSLFDDQLNIRI